MFIFAHIFAGALLGLAFWHLTKDRRAIPVCIAGSIIPDAIDKSLGLLFPSLLSSGRTVFHSLVLVLVICLITILFIRSDNRLLGVGFACAILLHQVFDEMWTLPANWFYPLLGPFQGSMIPDYILTFFLARNYQPVRVGVYGWFFGDSCKILSNDNRNSSVIPDRSHEKWCVYVCCCGVGSYGVVSDCCGTDRSDGHIHHTAGYSD